MDRKSYLPYYDSCPSCDHPEKRLGLRMKVLSGGGMTQGTSNWLIKLELLSRNLKLKEVQKNTDEAPRPFLTPAERKQTVVGGTISRDPINRQAALLLAPAHYLSKPPPMPLIPYETKTNETKRQSNHKIHEEKEKTANQELLRCIKIIKRMEANMRGGERSNVGIEAPVPRHGEYVSEQGIKIRMVDGQPMFDVESMNAFLIREIPNLIPGLNPAVQGAKDARSIIDDLLKGIGGEMEKFKLKTKDFLDDVRQTRYAIVAETSQITTSLRDVRQFFLGSDYEKEIARLREFVDLCERLNNLKNSGFLDKIADTILSLSVTK